MGRNLKWWKFWIHEKRDWGLVSFTRTTYHEVSRIFSELQFRPVNHTADQRVHCTWISEEENTLSALRGLSGECTWLDLADLFLQTHINFPLSFVLLLLCLRVHWRHISFWFPGRVRWADVGFAASGSGMSHVAFLLPYNSYPLIATFTASLSQWSLPQ